MFRPYGALKVRGYVAPVVVIEDLALQKMSLYVSEVDDEVGWLGTVQRVGNTFYISDVYLFEQEVHGATCEISPDSIAKLAEQLLMEEDGLEKANNIRMWGHSHVNMGVTPSSQDESQFDELAKNSADYFIRIIANKKGELRVDVLDCIIGLEYSEVQWQRHEEDLIDRNAIKSEIAQKVKKFAPKPVQYASYPKQTNYDIWGDRYGYGGNVSSTKKSMDNAFMACKNVYDLEDMGLEVAEMLELINSTAFSIKDYIEATFAGTLSMSTALHIGKIIDSNIDMLFTLSDNADYEIDMTSDWEGK